MKKESFVFTIFVFAWTYVLGVSSIHAQEKPGHAFVSVGESTITREEFEREVYMAARQTYYHGKPPAAEEYVEFRKKIADRLIERELLLIEAERRDIDPDTAAIDSRIAQYEARYGDSERWQTQGGEMIAALRERFQEDSVLERLEQEVRDVDTTDMAMVKAFYVENPGLFTRPASNHVAVILLGVPPSAGAPGWEAAREEARRIVERLLEGADFAELATLHSSDISSQAGGDMGYQHEGALSPEAEAAIAKLDVGEVSEPVRVLEGIAIFKLLDHRAKQLQAFADVEERAAELWARSKGEEQWQELVAGLRASTDIRIDTDYLAHVPGYGD